MSAYTPQQLAAIAARGNVLVAAGAGTGKTSTVTARCLDLIVREKCPVEQILMVTFTEAAAAEMRERIRHALRDAAAAAAPESEDALWLAEQTALLDTAPISTLHSFCLELVRRNFHVLGLDPQFSVLDESQTKPVIHTVLDALFEKHYRQGSEQSLAVAELVRTYGGGRDEAIRTLVLKIHQHAQTLAAPDIWLAGQAAMFGNASADAWRATFVEAVIDWSRLWRGTLEELANQSANVAACAKALDALPDDPTLEQAAVVLGQVVAADEAKWERGTKTKVRKPVEAFFASARFLLELTRDDGAPLAQDWEWSRGPMLALLKLAREFGVEFAKAKRELGGIDFADQEQFSLRLLLEDGQPTAIARACRDRFRFVFVDECQDINAAQDAILQAVSREGAAANRFLVGDVKQSIYRFRLANPRIFQGYQEHWLPGGASAAPVAASGSQEPQLDLFGLSPPPHPDVSAPAFAQVLSLTENFRSREALLQFINPVFRTLMRPVIGGLAYDTGDELHFGAQDKRATLSIGARRGGPPEVESQLWPQPDEVAPRVELHVLTKDNEADGNEESFEGDARRTELPDLQAIEREALLVARRLKQLQTSGHRVWNRERGGFVPVEYRDMVVLMRSTSARAEVFARAFHREGVPLHAGRAGFLDAQEVADVLNLLRLLDNPLQDLPLLAVLRSPFVGLSPEELVQVRLADRGGLLWTAMARYSEKTPESADATARKVRAFLDQFHRWRELIRHTSLTQSIETALTGTHYEALLLAGERGPERVANLRRLVEMARRFDPFQREGLFRFLQFIAGQEEVEARHEPAESFNEDSVRLMTIHASKGLEFPVVVLAGLGSRFNLRDLGNDILLHEDLGLCPKVMPPGSRTRFPSIVHWLASQRERRALLGEELRLLYVAMTRARDTLILTGTASRKDEVTRWNDVAPVNNLALVKAGCFLDWLRLWFTNETKPIEWQNEYQGANELLRWQFYGADDPALTLSNETDGDAIVTIQPPTSEELALIRERLSAGYEHAASVREPAKSSVTAIRQRAVDETDDEAQRLFQPTRLALAAPPIKDGSLSAAEIGTAHHTFLQFVALDRTVSESELRHEAARMRDAGALTVAEVAALDFAALTAFWQSDVGTRLRVVPARNVNREMPFTARFSVGELDRLRAPTPASPKSADDFVVVQGVVDLAVILPDEIWLLDFKTDHVAEQELPDKIALYAPQLRIYALALTRIYQRPVTQCWLHFLSIHKTVPVTFAEGP